MTAPTSPSRRLASLLLIVLAAIAIASCGRSRSRAKLRLATTTSVVDSGLLGVLLPLAEARTGVSVETSAVGSGKALSMLAAGEVDVAITHAPDLEEKAAQAGSVGRRIRVMHNEYVLVGPEEAVGVVAGSADLRDAMKKIATSGRPFVSRGDGSGTHAREQAAWAAAGIAADASFIVSSGRGMAETLELASERGAFTLADRSTFLMKRSGLDLAIVFQRDDGLRNHYSLVQVAKASPEVAEAARAFADFLRSAEGRSAIGRYGVEQAGEPLFTPAP